MRTLKHIICGVLLLLGASSNAQQPVKYEVAKIAETIILPPLTPKEAYDKSLKNGRPDESVMFGDFYNRANKIANELSTRTEEQIAITDKEKVVGINANSDGFGAMSTSEKAAYLRNNPELQKATGVSSSIFELATKMEDPAFKKKFDAMSDEQKAQFVMAYQSSSIQLNQKTHTQKALKTTIEAGILMSEFTNEVQLKAFANYKAESVVKMQQFDDKQEILLEPVLAEKSKLINKIGKGSSNAVGERLKELNIKEWMIKYNTYEQKLKYCRESVSALIATYKRYGLPVDNYFARINYGASLSASKEAKDLAQLAGYQSGLLKAIIDLQDISKNITYESALFYEKKLAADKSF